MSTPASSVASLLSPGEFLKRYDVRTVGDLCSDTGTRITSDALPSNPNLLAALDDAQGLVEAATLVSSRYLPADLSTLTGTGQRLLFRILADLTIGLLYKRRPDKGDPPRAFTDAMDWLDLLRKGERIFGLQEHAEAGLFAHEVETAAVVEARDGVVVQAENLFGMRARRLNG